MTRCYMYENILVHTQNQDSSAESSVSEIFSKEIVQTASHDSSERSTLIVENKRNVLPQKKQDGRQISG